MSLSTRFPVAVHILAFLAARSEDYTSSQRVAKSVASNPAAIRKLMGALSDAGLVTSQTGVNGGARLAKPAKSISLLDIYLAVEPNPLFQLHTPELKCPLTRAMLPALEKVFDRAETSLHGVLASQSLAEVSREAVAKLREMFG